MAHELSLLFKDWVQKVPAINDLYRRLKNITIWIRNHGDISTQFEEKLRAQFTDRRKWTIKPYMPGDTRMGTMYKLADRALQLKDILLALVTDPKYKASAQAAIQGYNVNTKVENRIPKGATEGGLGKQVTTTGVGPGNISRWKLILFQKFEFEKRGYFGTTKKILQNITPGNARQRPSNTR
jgi:hypothetical protein